MSLLCVGLSHTPRLCICVSPSLSVSLCHSVSAYTSLCLSLHVSAHLSLEFPKARDKIPLVCLQQGPPHGFSGSKGRGQLQKCPPGHPGWGEVARQHAEGVSQPPFEGDLTSQDPRSAPGFLAWWDNGDKHRGSKSAMGHLTRPAILQPELTGPGLDRLAQPHSHLWGPAGQTRTEAQRASR